MTVDIVQALDALDVSVKGLESYSDPKCTTYINYEESLVKRCLIGQALHELGVDDQQLLALGGIMIDSLWEAQALPLDLTLGAMLVFRAAQRSQDGITGGDEHATWGEALDAAIKTAGRFMDLMPDSIVPYFEASDAASPTDVPELARV